MPSLSTARHNRVGPGIAALLRLRGWQAAVAVSVAVLALAGIALGIGWLVTDTGGTSVYRLIAPVGSVELRLSDGDAAIDGGGPATLLVQHSERSAFGRAPQEDRSVTDGVLRVASSCPPIVIGSCSASYRLTVPDGVAIDARTTDGSLALAGVRADAQVVTGSGNISFDAFCGFGLSATSASGDIQVAAACAAKRIAIRSGSGNIKLLVPPGRYRIRAASGSGTTHVSGIDSTPSAPFTIDLYSQSGDVSVVGGL